MNTQPIRPDVVALLTDLTPNGHPEAWRHDDRRPVTPEETKTVMGATFAELRAARDYLTPPTTTATPRTDHELAGAGPTRSRPAPGTPPGSGIGPGLTNRKEITLNTVYTSQTAAVPTVRAANLATAGHHQAVVRCPKCRELHRHLGLGVRRGPCGQLYVVAEPRRARTAA